MGQVGQYSICAGAVLQYLHDVRVQIVLRAESEIAKCSAARNA